MIAMNYGIPIIATSIGGLAETVTDGETGLIVPPSDSAALALSNERFFRDWLSERFRVPISKTRVRLSWDALIRIIEETSNDLKYRHS